MTFFLFFRGNFGNLSMKPMQQVSKSHLHHMLLVSGNYVLHRERAKSFNEKSAMVINSVTDTLR